MRQIKFRVWHAGIKKMLYPPLAYDSSNHCRDIEGNIIEFISKNKKQHEPKVYFEAVMDWKGRWYEDGELQDTVFLQFTGLKDKTGREIYEGDIVKFTLSGEFVGEVAWFNHGWHFKAKDLGPQNEFPAFERLNGNKPEVIGNIFENPELLEKIK